MASQIRIDCIVGARPNFMKMAPILRAFAAQEGVRTRLIHTGQHYDVDMNAVFFEQLGLPSPDINLEIGSGTQTQQTAQVMMALEAELEGPAGHPDMMLVVGDVNSTVAATLVAAKLHIPLAHVEAGLRSFDMEMPEEVNRLVTDRLSNLLFTTERAAGDQLASEGVDPETVHFVGNVMIDTLKASLDKAPEIGAVLETHGTPAFAEEVARDGYGVVTLHRPSNVDVPEQLEVLLRTLAEIAEDLPLIFTQHPRTRARIDDAGLRGLLDHPRILVVKPLGYFEMVGTMRAAKLVVTDSGGLQEETTVLGVPCLTVRDNTERPITISQGTNTLIGRDMDALREAVNAVLTTGGKAGRTPELWDGKSAERIAETVTAYCRARRDG